MRLQVTVWVCPTPGCGNYYGASSAGDLTQQLNRRTSLRNLATEDSERWGAVTSARSECPDCRSAGRGAVDRVPIDLSVEVPEVVAAA